MKERCNNSVSGGHLEKRGNDVLMPVGRLKQRNKSENRLFCVSKEAKLESVRCWPSSSVEEQYSISAFRFLSLSRRRPSSITWKTDKEKAKMSYAAAPRV